MARILLLFLSLFAFTYSSISQTYWAHGVGGAGGDEALSVATDPAGNTYTTGYFSIVSPFGSTTLTAQGVTDIFLMKTDALGAMQWAVQAGGIQSDRGLGVYADGSHVYVTGFFAGSATFGSTTLNSNNGTQDIFVAKYTQAGVLVWAQSFGGTLAEQGNAIVADANGNVIVTGQFRGTVTFGTTTLTSMTDPVTGQPSLDVFTLKLSPAGNVVWVEHGTAKHTDRGMDVAVTSNGDVYVTGVFSDTITFDVMHTNGPQNAGFLIKYDSTGAEQWFRMIIGGLFAVPNGIAASPNGGIFVTGDFGGTLSFSGSPITQTNIYTNRFFIVRFNTSGTVIWVENDASSSDLTVRDIAVDSSNIYLTGHFKCVLNEYADQYGQGTFNSAGFWDVFTSVYTQAGARLWMRNLGGDEDDQAHGVAAIAGGYPVIAGSYRDTVWLPLSANTAGYNLIPNPNVAAPSTYCNDTLYHSFGGFASPGSSNAFATTLLNPSRQPMDYYRRSGTGCNRDQLPVCISLTPNESSPCGPDTVYTCHPITLYANTQTAATANVGGVGYQAYYTWSDGLALPQTAANVSGTYWVRVESADGCFVSTDTIVVIISPPPCISDNFGPNTDTSNYSICPPLPFQAWGGCEGNSVQSYWITPNNGQIFADTITITSPGPYAFCIVDSSGCASCANMVVDTPLVLPPIVVAPDPFPNDTLTLCEGTPYFVYTLDTVGLFATLPSPPAGMLVEFCISYNGGPYLCDSMGASIMPLVADSSGTYHVTFTMYGFYNNTCGSDTVRSDSSYTYYLNVLPAPDPTVNISGVSWLCPGSTDTLFANGSGGYSWQGPASTALNDSTRLVNLPGQYTAFTTVTYPNGCIKSGFDMHIVYLKPTPLISTDPPNGVICPGDSVELSLNVPGSVVWMGPSGLVDSANFVYVSSPGLYYAIVTDLDSCTRVSNTIEIKQFTTPYIAAFPDAIVCNGDSAKIEIIGTDGVTVTWLPPLSGSAAFHYVTQPDTYRVIVDGCGMYDTLDITVSPSATVATISPPGTTEICPGDSVYLVANPNMPAYLWSPSGGNDSLLVTQAGAYTVIVYDSLGCWDVSDTAFVAIHITPLPALIDTTICYGTSASITAGGGGVMNWYASPVATTPIFTGATFQTPILFSDSIFYVDMTDSLCTSLRTAVQVQIDSASMPFTATANTPVCLGSTLQLNAPFVSGASYLWNGPPPFSSTLQNPSITNIQANQAGNYIVQRSSSLCPLNFDTISVTVTPLPVVVATADTVLCQGDSLFLAGNTLAGAGYSWSGPGGFLSSQEDTIRSNVTPLHSGNYILYIVQNGCINSDTATVLIHPTPVTPTPLVNTPVCEFDTAFFGVPGGASTTYDWSGPGGFSSTLQNPQIDCVLVAQSGLYSVIAFENGCPSDTGSVQLLVIDVPDSTIVSFSSPVCEGDILSLGASGPAGSTYNWVGPQGFGSSLEDPVIPNVTTLNSGLYTVTVVFNGCTIPQGQANIIVNPIPAAPIASANTPLCAGDTLYLTSTHGGTGSFDWSGPGNFISISQDTLFQTTLADSGYYYVTFTQDGCVSPPDSVSVEVIPSPGDPNPRATGPFCEGNNMFLIADSTSGASYQWNGPHGFYSDRAYTWIIPSDTAMSGTYILNAQLGPCSIGPFEVPVEIHPNPSIDLGPDTAMCMVEPYILVGPPGFSEYTWQDGSTGENYPVIYSGNFILTVRDVNGCLAIDNINIDYANCLDLVIPNTFTPNGDGMNDIFTIWTEGLTGIKVEIYNRWGLLLYEYADLNGGWNGEIHNSDRVAPEGVYYWVAEFEFYNGSTRSARGFLHLFR